MRISNQGERSAMSGLVLAKAFGQLTSAISLCAAQQLTTPALILLYSGIDIASWLHADNPNDGVRKRFVAWAERYLLPATPLKCTALELYAARCGVVHTFSPDADLTRQGKARKIVYAMRPSQVGTLAETITLVGMKNYVAVQLEDLMTAFSKAVEEFLKDLEANQAKLARAQKKATQIFTKLSQQEGQDLLTLGACRRNPFRLIFAGSWTTSSGGSSRDRRS
jgi:hypothetical protein